MSGVYSQERKAKHVKTDNVSGQWCSCIKFQACLHICMRSCIHIYILMHVHKEKCVNVYVCDCSLCSRRYCCVYMYICVSDTVCIHVHRYIYIYMCTHTAMYIYVFTYVERKRRTERDILNIMPHYIYVRA